MTVSRPRRYPVVDLDLDEKPGQFVELTGEKRPPCKGEWYVSGAIPRGYRALEDLTQVHYIARLVKSKETL